ncbi:L-aminoadipate-semialdehyde dehydrogenase-phosphopantetheinyl transferase-like [Thrips palmi]|uniref:L-aminoadipate-semialdehyde dehydrogenase-phosphopantetheinyl transferase n=1 Tax=Thrips palmi TaxID=161013 RepID=A0A6P8YA79_THRPL|nr:L-aminoadipate-semialdehyde dehydrogenase-phosphopantetheinyl transferase-like [Thrips palmi]
MTEASSIRWAFNTKEWDPSVQEWLIATSSIPLEEKERIQKFVFKADAKASIAGCLMSRKFAHLATGEPYDKLTLVRNEAGRPYLKYAKHHLDFNVSHQGNFTVFAGEKGNDVNVGVDIVKFENKTGFELAELFRLMKNSFTSDEWNTILRPDSEEKKSAMFFRHWCLKESYVKATGVGICMDLQKISFKVNTESLSSERPCTDTVVEINKVDNTSWKFHEWLLDPEHCVAVALSHNDPLTTPPVPFTMLSWADLVQEAKPLLPPDMINCELFMRKKESVRSLDA